MSYRYQTGKPVSRSKLRMALGRIYFTWRRYGQWVFNRSNRYALSLGERELSHSVAAHKTPLYIHTPLTITERWRHTHDVFPDANRTQPFGSGATVVYNYVDLQIRNGTPYEYQLMVRVGDNDLEGEWRCEHPSSHTFQIYESEHLIKQEWWGGYTRHNVIQRKVLDLSGELVADEFVTENHALMMYEPLLQAGEESDTMPSTTLHDTSCDSEFTSYYPKS